MIKIMKYGEVPNSEIFARAVAAVNVEDIVTDIIANVRANGDKAIKEYTEKFDKAILTNIQVTPEEMQEALDSVEPKFLEVLEKAAANIRKFHECQKRNSFIINDENGIVMGQKIIPMDKAGLYVPGGTAAYPSSVLMDSIPAKVAGCKDFVMVTPPNKEGKINPVILAAAHVAGVDRIFKVGGAQAIAALAYGTETIPKVDKIVGPGNAFVAEAKKQVYGTVSIDMIAGPSEILVVADEKSNPKYVAADLLSQAEHDKLACAVLVTNSMDLANKVAQEIENQLPKLIREEIARTSIENNGKIIVADTLDVVIEIANEIAPEHLELCVDNPFDYLDSIRHAGSIFMGRNCPEALGDYFAGPNHTLPTSGTARFSSPLGVDDFIKKTQYT
ncbi:MAG: histidinol dehydrogenase, partial [Clostridia bacterium]|nr:histidinol dehydrogenase [Clostridia bacterium]